MLYYFNHAAVDVDNGAIEVEMAIKFLKFCLTFLANLWLWGKKLLSTSSWCRINTCGVIRRSVCVSESVSVISTDDMTQNEHAWYGSKAYEDVMKQLLTGNVSRSLSHDWSCCRGLTALCLLELILGSFSSLHRGCSCKNFTLKSIIRQFTIVVNLFYVLVKLFCLYFTGLSHWFFRTRNYYLKCRV